MPPLASDEEFFRRIYIDLAGRTPHDDELRAFLESKDPDKRDKLVDKLITTADGECHFQLLRRSRRLCVALGHHRGRVRRRGP